jgi:hypothetical protein
VTSSMLLAVFEDFNEPRDEPSAPSAEDVPPPADDIGETREIAWTEGYLTGRQQSGAGDSDQPLAAKLVTSIYELGAKTSEAVDAAALAVADLLVDTVITVASDAWSAQLLDRVRAVADRIKPAVAVAPEFVLRDAHGTVRQFGELSDLSRALEAGDTAEDVTIRWQRGEAIISRRAILEDLREAIIPLSAGRAHRQDARNQT